MDILSRFLKVFSFLEAKPRIGNSADTVRYSINNSGGLELDAEALVNSEGWKRQVAAAKRIVQYQRATGRKIYFDDAGRPLND